MNNSLIYRKEAWYDLLSILRTPAFVIPSLAFPVVFYGPALWAGYLAFMN